MAGLDALGPDGRARPCSAATPWPAPASSTASSPSSRPRPPRPRAVAELETPARRRRRRSIDVPLSLHVNGCPNSCARIQTADIGLKGQIVTDDDGDQVEGFQVHLGGGARASTRGLGRTVRGLKVTAEQVPDYVERVVRNFVADREPRRALRRPGPSRADEEAPGMTTTVPLIDAGAPARAARARSATPRLAAVSAALGRDATARRTSPRWARPQLRPASLAVACSMEDASCRTSSPTQLPGVDVLFLETGYHFPETLRDPRRGGAHLPVTVVDVLPRQTVAEQDAEYGPRLHDRDPTCAAPCARSTPLARTLEGYEALGHRRPPR